MVQYTISVRNLLFVELVCFPTIKPVGQRFLGNINQIKIAFVARSPKLVVGLQFITIYNYSFVFLFEVQINEST
jgi:hypothetical protein